MISLRAEINAKAAERLLKFITVDRGLAVRAFARMLKIPEPTLRYFLGAASAADTTRRHGRGPYKKTLQPILQIKSLPPDLREMLLDVVDFETRVAFRMLSDAETAAQTSAQAGR